MLPEVEKYLADVKAAEELHKTARAEIDKRYQVSVLTERYSDEFRRIQDAARAELNNLNEALLTALESAWDALAASSDRGVAFIARVCKNHYRSEGVVALKALPLTRSELVELAERQGWCEEYERLADEAEEEGVFDPNRKPYGQQRRVLGQYIRENVSSYYASLLRQKIDAAITEAVNEAKAEWSAALTLKKDDVTPAESEK